MTVAIRTLGSRCRVLAFIGLTVLVHPAYSQAVDRATLCARVRTIKRSPNATTRIDTTMVNRRGADSLPEHCEIFGRINERSGFNSQRYAIRFHLRLPTQWNGRFFFEGGGGANGRIGEAIGPLFGRHPSNALKLGYAVVSQDSGHDTDINNDPSLNGPYTFGFDPQARLDFGYNSYDQVTQVAKVLVRAYYGRAPVKSYYVGASEGGREGMMMAERFPSYFDGILSVVPGFRLPKASVFGQAWDVQAFAEVARAESLYDRFGQPFLNKTFTDEDLHLVSQAVAAACDSLDGLVDGVIDDFPACTTGRVSPKLDAVTCRTAKTPACLTATQVRALKKVYDGARNSRGALVYADWPWDTGIGGRIGDRYYDDWRSWKIGPFSGVRTIVGHPYFDGRTNSGINQTLGAGASSAIFTTPPTPLSAYGDAFMKYLLAFDFDGDTAKIHATSAGGSGLIECCLYSESAWDFMMASSTNRAEFRDRGGKHIIVQGVSDPIFSVNDIASWWQDLDRVNGGKASDFVRLFAVPGMGHGSDGPTVARWDAFAALVAWVEKGIPPDRIVGHAEPDSPWPGRTRPLCPYPAQSRYNGSGSIDDERNFTCTRR